MSTIQDLPEEILPLIFQNLTFTDLQQCQITCRSWYYPAHVRLLTRLSLEDSEIEKFIAAIDYNPSTSYLNAVKQFYINSVGGGIQPPDQYQGAEETINKLFLRFPNLEHVELGGSVAFLDAFNDDICNKILSCCPKLDTFEVYTLYTKDPELYPHVLWKLRKLLTTIIIPELVDAEPPVDVMQFITGLPRLQKISTYFTSEFDSFHHVLQAVHQLSKLKELDVTFVEHEEGFAEEFFATKTSDEKKTIIERLSKITVLDLSFDPGVHFCVNTIKFVAKYLTGINNFELTGYENDSWTDLHRQVFCDDLVNVLCSAIDHGSVHLAKIKFSDMAAIIPSITHSVFQSTTKWRSLLVDMTNDIKDKQVGNMNIRTKGPKIEIQTSKKLGLQELTSILFTRTIENIDKFTLYLNQKHDVSIDANLYIEILEKMQSLKMVILDIPASIKEIESTYNNNVSFPLIKEASLQTTPNAPLQAFLDRHCSIFPSLEKLNLFCYSGTWHEGIGEFRIVLTGYHLQRLSIDMTPVKAKLKNILKKEELTEQDFFTLNLHVGGDRRLYKLSYGLSSVCRINDSDLGSYIQGVDYVQVDITIADLERLKIYMLYDEDGYDTDKDEDSVSADEDESDVDTDENEELSDSGDDTSEDWESVNDGEDGSNDEQNNSSTDENDDDDSYVETDVNEEYRYIYDLLDCREYTIMLKD